MFIERTISKIIKKAARQFPIIALTGPRQSGKTTLVQRIFSKLPYVSLEDLDTRAFAQSDPRGFLETYPRGAIFDEVQRTPELFSYIQGVVDHAKKQGQYILTGSQNFLLHEHITQSLSGRVSLLTLLPLSIEELLQSDVDLGEQYAIPLFKGLYPRLYETTAPIDVVTWYSNYILTYIERDVRNIKNITDLSAFQLFLKLCAGRTGQLLNLSALANDCGITHNTARSWLSVLEASFVVFLLRPHHKNFNKRLVKMPKLYFVDTGIACSLLGIENYTQLETHSSKGGLFESLIIGEFIKYRLNRGRTQNCFFWRDSTGHEIDCIIETENNLIPIEVKSGRTISDDYFKDIRYWSALSGLSTRDAFVIYGGLKKERRIGGTVLGWKTSIDMFLKR